MVFNWTVYFQIFLISYLHVRTVHPCKFFIFHLIYNFLRLQNISLSCKRWSNMSLIALYLHMIKAEKSQVLIICFLILRWCVQPLLYFVAKMQAKTTQSGKVNICLYFSSTHIAESKWNIPSQHNTSCLLLI